MKKKIHVNQHAIRANAKHGTNEPVVTVKTYKSNDYGHTVAIHGNSAVVYDRKGMQCGAKVWVETNAAVTVYDEHGELIADIS